MDLVYTCHHRTDTCHQNNQFDIHICNRFRGRDMWRRLDMDLDRIHSILSHNARQNSLEDIRSDITGL